jgi:hypothetical protein
MALQFGRLTAMLADLPASPSTRFVDIINQRVEPDRPVTAEQIYVGAMYLVSDEVNSFGGRFPVEEHQRIAELLIDSPVLVGHRKDHLPIARNFHAELVDRDNQSWVKSYFYWLRSVDDADTLKANIEGGIYKECSIAFTYNLPECSICGHDIRLCEHEPFSTYPTTAGPAVCHFAYRQIERVLESSLVYRGAVPNTRVTREETSNDVPTLHRSSSMSPQGRINLMSLDSLSDLDHGSQFLVVPHYDALPVTATTCDGKINLSRLDSSPLRQTIYQELGNSPSVELDNAPGLLIGFQGRQRCSCVELEKYIADRSGPISRVVLALYPDTRRGVWPNKHRKSLSGVRTLPYRIADFSGLPSAVRQLSTRDGVEIWPLTANPLTDSGFEYNRLHNRSRRIAGDHGQLFHQSSTRTALLFLTIDGHNNQFRLRDFDSADLQSGKRFLADRLTDALSNDEVNLTEVIDGSISVTHRENTGIRFSFEDRPDSSYAIRPITLGGRERFLVSCHAVGQRQGRKYAQR